MNESALGVDRESRECSFVRTIECGRQQPVGGRCEAAVLPGVWGADRCLAFPLGPRGRVWSLRRDHEGGLAADPVVSAFQARGRPLDATLPGSAHPPCSEARARPRGSTTVWIGAGLVLLFLGALLVAKSKRGGHRPASSIRGEVAAEAPIARVDTVASLEEEYELTPPWSRHDYTTFIARVVALGPSGQALLDRVAADSLEEFRAGQP